MKSRNILKLLFVMLASASVVKQSSAILPAALIPASVAGKCLLGYCTSNAAEFLYRAVYKYKWEEKNRYHAKGSIWYTCDGNTLLCGYYFDRKGNGHEIPRLPIITKANLVTNIAALLTADIAFCIIRAPIIWGIASIAVITGQV